MRLSTLTLLSPCVAALALAVTPPRAAACSVIGNGHHELDPAEIGVDTTPPTALAGVDAAVVRRPSRSDCGGDDSCSDIGIISLVLTPGSDDRTPTAELGYRLVLLSGRLPRGASLPSEAIRPALDDELVLSWLDQSSTAQESFGAVIGVIPVDLAGNEGPQFEVRIDDDVAGCAAGGPLPDRAGWLLLALVALVAVRARVQRRA